MNCARTTEADCRLAVVRWWTVWWRVIVPVMTQGIFVNEFDGPLFGGATCGS